MTRVVPPAVAPPVDATVAETTQWPGVALPWKREAQAGVMVREVAPGAAATYAYDALYRVGEVQPNVVRMTTIGYEAIYGQLPPPTVTTHSGYRVYAVQPTAQEPHGTGVSNVITVSIPEN